MEEELINEKRLDNLRHRHRELDDQIVDTMKRSDEFTLSRLKKQKLHLRDQIIMLESVLYPDITA